MIPHSVKKAVSSRFDASNESTVFWMFSLAALLITMIISPGLISTEHEYRIGDVAKKNVKSPRELYVEDAEATRIKREEAVRTVLTVYDFDEAMAGRTAKRVRTAFGVAANLVSDYESSRSREDSGAEGAVADGEAGVSPALAPPARSLDEILDAYKPEFEKTMGIQVSKSDFTYLKEKKFPSLISENIIHFVQMVLDDGVVANKEILLKESEKGIMLRGIESQSEVYKDRLKKIYGHGRQAKEMVRVFGAREGIKKKLKDDRAWEIIADFSERLIRPNITMNKLETENRKKLAGENVTPVHYRIKAGEVLLREGDQVTSRHLLKLNALQDEDSKVQAILKSVGIGCLMLFFLIVLYYVFLKSRRVSWPQQFKDLILMCSVLLVFFLIGKAFLHLAETAPHGVAPAPFSSFYVGAAPLAGGAMVISIFLGLEAALPFAILMAFCASALFENPFQTWTYFFLCSVMGAFWLKECRERTVFIKTGLKLGMLNVGLMAAMYFYSGSLEFEVFLIDSAMAFMGGIAAGVLTAGIVPMVELLFDYSTDIKLLELANLDQPVLRRLMLEAPGTYHHSVIVGSMVEAAAATIGANPLLARVCGYYHDIGKIKKPLYFIENQMGGKNRHDKLAPSMSSLILIAHVRDGVAMARKSKLGAEITDTIQQHHGTSLIAFFFEKAKLLRGEDAVSEDDFRYPGPKPQTKEAGLVMLADVVEAASRTLENPTPARIQGLVQRLINNVFSDGQLDECELTLKDLHQIAKSFNQILSGIYHHRVEYSDSQGKEEGKKSIAGADGQPTKGSQNKSEEDGNGGAASLKRLGLS